MSKTFAAKLKKVFQNVKHRYKAWIVRYQLDNTLGKRFKHFCIVFLLLPFYFDKRIIYSNKKAKAGRFKLIEMVSKYTSKEGSL